VAAGAEVFEGVESTPLPVRTSGVHVVASAQSSTQTRSFAFLMLFGLTFLFCYGAFTVYQVMRDSFVAPTILSPDSDLVLASKLKMRELELERTRSLAEREGLDSELHADEEALARLEDLHTSAQGALDWTAQITSQKAWASAAELKALADQRRVMVAMLEQQRAHTEKARSDRDAGIVSRTDFEKEEQAQRQLELGLLENERAALQSQSALKESALAQQSLAKRGPVMPELITRQEQLIRLELEVSRLESERRSKQALKRAVDDRIAKIDEYAAQLRGRPMFRAIERSVDVAFVPYTQLPGVVAGASVYSCVWGLFLCKPVGTVTEVVPGEVVLPDPWGNQARGQYAVLELSDRDAAKSKTLRVRSVPPASTSPAGPVRVTAN
jgi:hypothetical protein